MTFLQFQKDRSQRGDITPATLGNLVKAIKLFCEMSDIQIPWKKITRGLPRIREAANDRAPTIEETKKLIDYPDRRIKSIILVMASSGIRIGAWDYLKWKHVTPIKNEKGQVVAAKIIVYANDVEEYYSFITPEAFNCLREWMDSLYSLFCGLCGVAR
jgi:integrase